jgi:hypothetical protein
MLIFPEGIDKKSIAINSHFIKPLLVIVLNKKWQHVLLYEVQLYPISGTKVCNVHREVAG